MICERARWLLPNFLIGIFLLGWSSSAVAEVADKVPSLTNMWVTTLVVNIFACILGLKKPLMALLVLPVSAFLIWGGLSELNDPWVGPAIRRELGQGYIDQSYYALAITVLGPVALFAILALMHRKQNY